MIKTDLEWTKYVLGQLDKKTEIIDGNPTCAGLARIFERSFGKILGKGIRVLRVPDANDSRATVVCFLNYCEYPVVEEDGEFRYAPENMGNYEDLVACSVEAGVDSSMELLPEPFNHHIISSLDTRAYSRALKQAMCLNCFTDEEMKLNDAHRNKISPVTVESILNRVKKLELDTDKFLTVYASCTSQELVNLSAEAGHDLLETISNFEDNPDSIPAEIK